MKNEETNLAIIALRLPTVERYIYLLYNSASAHVSISTKHETHATTDAAAGGT
jgi:hypothetical protein